MIPTEPSASAGYSGRSPAQKLGIKPQGTVALFDAPAGVEGPRGMIDSKVCPIDETWSGLRLTRRRG